MRIRPFPILSMLALGASGIFAQNLATVPGADPGAGIPYCDQAEGKGWYSLFDGTIPTLEKYWFLPPGQRHGNGGKWTVVNGMLNSDQTPDRTGGALFTKKKYKNVEVNVNIKPYFGNDGGIFFRSTTYDKSYQVVIDYLQGDTKAIGGVYGESGLHAINYKPFGFVSADKITVGTQHHWNEVQTESPNNWATKIWKVNDFNWVRSRIYHDDPPWIDSWVNGYQLINYKDNTVEADNLTGYIGLQIHTGSGNWSINNPNIYKAFRVRELKPDGNPLDGYPDWESKCATRIKSGRANPENRLEWAFDRGGVLRVSGILDQPHVLRVTNLSGETVFRAQGQPGSWSHRIGLPQESGIHFLQVDAGGLHRSVKVVRAGGFGTLHIN